MHMLTTLKNARLVTWYTVVLLLMAEPAVAQEVVVFGSVDEVVTWLQAENWWGQEQHGEQLQVPNAIITGISKRWRVNAQKMPVPEKKEIFYRFILPLVMHANRMVLERRSRLRRISLALTSGSQPHSADLEWL